MTLNLSNYAPALKQYYSDTRVENMVYKDHPFMAMVAKDEKFYGKNMPLPIIIGNPQGRSATFSVAQQNKGNSRLRDFVLTRDKDYSLASIDNETAEASENDAGAFLKALTVEIDGAFQSATNSMAHSLFNDGSGSIGQIDASTNVATDQLVLTDAESVVYFEIGQFINFAQQKSAGALRDSGNTLEVVAVDRDGGVVTVSAALNTIAGIATGDFVFVEGDRNLKLKGLDAWLPATAPTVGDNFFGVDRSADPTRLGGIRVDGSSLPIEEALIKGAARVGREGGRPDYCFMSYGKFEDLEKSLGSKVQYVKASAYGRADIGFDGIKIKGPKGDITVLADPFCQSDTAWMLSMKSWKVYSLKKAIRILDLDGNKMLRESNADANELRIGGYCQLGCNAPGHNARITL